MKPFGEYYEEYADHVNQLLDRFSPSATPVGEQAQRDFIALFGTILRLRNILVSFDEFLGNEILTERQFDLVTSMEVIEHVTDPAAFVAGLASALAPGGLMILSTPNRTPLSRIAMITLGEGTGAIPKGTHNWDRFLAPDELEALLAAAGLRVTARRGLSLSPARGFVISDNEALNYLVSAVRT